MAKEMPELRDAKKAWQSMATVAPLFGAMDLSKEVEKLCGPPKSNVPCADCKKPTRSHHDPKTGKVLCHVCWLKRQEEGEKCTED